MKKIAKFFAEARTELMKVSWPSRAAAIQLTLTVLGVSLVFALYIAGADLLITQGLKWITTKSQTQTQTGGRQIDAPPLNLKDIQAIPAE